MSFEPNNITKDHVLSAIERIEREQIDLKGATKYEVVINGKNYPPKEIMRYAHEEMNGEYLWEYSGGESTNKFLKEMGYKIVPKGGGDPILVLIENYKKLIRKKGLKDEVYKWEFVSRNKGVLENTNDVAQTIEDIKWTNAIYHMSVATLKLVGRTFPDELARIFAMLKNESIALEDRIQNFENDFEILYRKAKGGNSIQQDERSISNYLTLIDPEKYIFYKNSYYQKYCKYIGVKPKNTGKKLSHYYELLDELIQDYISQDNELIDIVKNEIPEYYDGSNHLLLAQDILYEVLDRERIGENYWIFQGNPDTYDFKAALEQGGISDWNVTAHKAKIHEGDKGIIWLTGKNAGVYGLLEVVSEPRERGKDDDPNWKKEHKADYVVDIEFEYNLFDHPILKEEIDRNEVLKDLNVGNQGTNFTATKKEYEEIQKLIEKRMKSKKYWLYQPGEGAKYWEQFYNEGIIGLGWWQLGDLRPYKSKEVIREKLIQIDGSEGSRKNDTTANWEFVHEMKEGDIIIVKKGISELLGYGEVISDYYFEENADFQPSRRKVQWIKKGSWSSGKKMVVKTLTDISEYESDSSGYQWYYQYLLGQMGENPMDKNSNNMKQPLNQILYGPPGTGKTYKLKNEYFEKYTSRETSITREKHLENIVKECSWWQVIAIALLDLKKAKVSDISEHEIIKKKEELSNSNTVRPTLWGQLQTHTIEECENVNISKKRPPFIFNKTEDSFWEILEEEVQDQVPEILELRDQVINFKPNPDKLIKRYRFTTFHQSFSYEDFIEGIKPKMSQDDEESDLGYVIEDGVFKDLCKEAELDPENKYAIFIDEINRGNVSQIFGELITLIESDKRKGEDNEMSAVLPYSKKRFMVPSNVDIIGTMNTADRSVEALDSALRRRFTFKEMLPNPSLLDGKDIEGISLKEVLETINERIEMLVDRDHTIGHSYLINLKGSKEALAIAFNDKIVPLLQEYFYGDYGKIGLVLGKGFVEVKKAKNDVFAEFSYENANDFISDSYELKKVNAANIIEALELLLGKEKEE